MPHCDRDDARFYLYANLPAIMTMRLPRDFASRAGLSHVSAPMPRAAVTAIAAPCPLRIVMAAHIARLTLMPRQNAMRTCSLGRAGSSPSISRPSCT